MWFLVDGIYPEIARFAKTLEEAIGEDRKMYVRWQEGCRKSIARAFGVLKRKFQILRKDVEEFHLKTINDIVVTTIMLHNMMVAHRIEQGQTESEEYYVCGDKDDNNILNGEKPDQAEEIIERRDAELRVLLETDRAYNTSGVPNLVAEEHALRQRWLSFYNEVNLLRWKSLYDQNRHYTLRESIINQLRMNRQHTIENNEN